MFKLWPFGVREDPQCAWGGVYGLKFIVEINKREMSLHTPRSRITWLCYTYQLYMNVKVCNEFTKWFNKWIQLAEKTTTSNAYLHLQSLNILFSAKFSSIFNISQNFRFKGTKFMKNKGIGFPVSMHTYILYPYYIPVLQSFLKFCGL